MLSIALCNDNPEDTLEISDIFKELKESFNLLINIFSTPKELLLSLKNNHYLDIIVIKTYFNNIKKNGIDVVKYIHTIFPHIEIIFMSSTAEQIENIFEADCCYCIFKPFTKEKFTNAFRKAINNIDKNKERPIFIPNQKAKLLLNPAQILYCERKQRTTYIHYNDEIYTTNIKLDELINVLPSKFVRTHVSYLVNLSRVKKFESLFLTLDNNQTIPVSKQRKNNLKNAITRYISEYRVHVIY